MDPELKRGFQIVSVNLNEMRSSGSSGYACKEPTNLSREFKVIVTEGDYRVVAIGKCFGQVRFIGPKCYRWFHKNGETGTAESLEEGFRKIGFRYHLDNHGEPAVTKMQLLNGSPPEHEPPSKNGRPRLSSRT